MTNVKAGHYRNKDTGRVVLVAKTRVLPRGTYVSFTTPAGVGMCEIGHWKEAYVPANSPL